MNINFIKKVHYKLTRGTYDEYRYNVNEERPGEFKRHDYVTGINEVGSYPHEVEIHLKELLDEVNSYDGEDHFTVGVYFHAMFENIHPFADGNGRMGRFVILKQCLESGVDLIAIDEVYEKEYKEALFKAQKTDDSECLINVFKKCQEKLDGKTLRYSDMLNQVKKECLIERENDDFDLER